MSKYIYAVLGTIIAGLALALFIVSKKLESTQNELIATKTSLDMQNASILATKADFEAYKAQHPKVKEKIIYRYKDVIKADESCQAELAALKQIMDIFFSRGQ